MVCLTSIFPHPWRALSRPFCVHARNGYWIGSRDRRLRLSEAALLHGFLPSTIIWPSRPAGFAMLGNTMSACVLQRLFVRLLGALGVHLPDPWESGAAQASLLRFVRSPSPLRTFHFRARLGARPSVSSAPYSRPTPALRPLLPRPPFPPVSSVHSFPLARSARQWSPAQLGHLIPCRPLRCTNSAQRA